MIIVKVATNKNRDFNRSVFNFFDFRQLFGHLTFLLMVASVISAETNPAVIEEDPLLGEVANADRLFSIADREQDLMDAISRPEGQLIDEDTLLKEAQSIISLYEGYLADYPEDATALLLYSKFLMIVGRPYEAGMALLRLDEARPNIPVVKQQLGNLAAEEGDYLAAITWLREAIRLAPLEPVYRYQKGILLDTFREQYIESGQMSREELDELMLTAFTEASELAPNNRDLKARLAEAYYDLGNPDWEAALRLWEDLAKHPLSETEDQVLSLHLARVHTELNQLDKARKYLKRVTHPALEHSRRNLMAKVDEKE